MRSTFWCAGLCLIGLNSLAAYGIAAHDDLKQDDLKKLMQDIKLPDLSKIHSVNPFEKHFLSADDALLNDLQFVGVLRSGKEIWGLIRKPSGFVFSVKEGEILNNTLGRIVTINDQNIVIQQTQRVGNVVENIILRRHL